tara:strand:+ start:113 stop:493 length:381 start_codon:yes stop_codon:yes gene_type:complete
MPRKSLDELEATPAPAEKEKKADATVVSTEDKTTRKVKLDLEVDTSVKDMGPNPYAKIIHMARAVDAWRIFPRLFLTVYIILLYRCVIWYMNLADPTMEQSGLISIVVGAGAAWFGLYTGTDKSRK